jgi:hypothetical protein
VLPCLIYTCRARAVPMPCYDYSVLKVTSQGPSTARHGMCGLASAVQRRHVGDLSAFGFFRLPRRVQRRLLPEAYQSQMQLGYFCLPRGLSRRTLYSENDRGAAWYVRINAAGERHSMCGLALSAQRLSESTVNRYMLVFSKRLLLLISVELRIAELLCKIKLDWTVGTQKINFNYKLIIFLKQPCW